MWTVENAPGNDVVTVDITVLPDPGTGSNPVIQVSLRAPDAPETWVPLSGGFATGARTVASPDGDLHEVQLRVVTSAGAGAASDIKTVIAQGTPAAVGAPDPVTSVAGGGDILLSLTPYFEKFGGAVWSIQSVDPMTDRVTLDFSGGNAALLVLDGEPLAASTVVVRVTNAGGFAEQTFSLALTAAAEPDVTPDVGVTAPAAPAMANANALAPASWSLVSTPTTASLGSDQGWTPLRVKAVGASSKGIRTSIGAVTASAVYRVWVLLRENPEAGTVLPDRVAIEARNTTASTFARWVADIGSLQTAATTSVDGGTMTFVRQSAPDAGGWRLAEFDFTPNAANSYDLRILAWSVDGGFDIRGGGVALGGRTLTTFDVLAEAPPNLVAVSEVAASAGSVGMLALVGGQALRINADGSGEHYPVSAVTDTTEITRAFTARNAGSTIGATATLTLEGAPGPAIASDDDVTITPAAGALAVSAAEAFDPASGALWTDDYQGGSGGGTSAGAALGAFADPVLVTNGGGPLWEGRQIAVTLAAGETVDVIYASAEGTSPRVSLHLGRPVGDTPAASYLHFLWTDPTTPVAIATAAGTLTLVGAPAVAGGVTFWTVRFTAPTAGAWRFKLGTGGATGTVWLGAIIPVRAAAAGNAVADVLANDDASRVTEVAGDPSLVGVPRRLGAGATLAVIDADGRVAVIGADLADADVTLGYTADRGAGGVGDTAILTVSAPAIAAPPPGGAEFEPSAGIYHLTGHPVNSARLLVAGPSRVVVEAPDAIITAGTYNETTRTTSAIQRADNGWRSTGWGSWVASGDSAITASLAGRYAVPSQTVGANLTDRARLHRALLTLSRTPANGEAITVHPGNAALAVSVEVQPWARSAIVQAPAHGFHPADGEKWALVGGWFATGVTSNAWLSEAVRYGIYNMDTLQPVAGWAFSDGRTLAKIRNAADVTAYGNAGANWSMGADLYKADITAFTTPGRYVIAVEGCGATAPFDIHPEVHKPLLRFLATGMQHCEHDSDFRPNAAIPAVNAHGPTMRHIEKRVTGRSAASVTPDGLASGQGKLWDNNMPSAHAEFPQVPETDPVLAGFPLDDVLEAHRDAADYDARPMHAVTNALMMAAAMAMPSAHGVDLGRGEGRRAYSKTVQGGAITGTAALSDFDHATLHNVDGYARMQVIKTAGAWAIGGGRLPASLGAWEGATAGQYELGGYIGSNRNFQTWAQNPIQPDKTYRLWRTRPDPWSTYCAASGFGMAALRMQQIGDTGMRAYYLARAQAAWAWASANEGANSSISYTSNSGAASKQNWSTGWRTNDKFQSAKANAAVALYALTGAGSYHDAFLATTNALTLNSPTAPGIAYLALSAAGLMTPVSGTLATLKTNALTRLDAAAARTASQTQSAFGRPEGIDHNALAFNNHIGHAKNLTQRLLPALLVWIGDPAAVSSPRRSSLRALIANEIGFISGRTPSGQSCVTMLGDNPPREIQFSDWQGMGRNYAPPGLVPFGFLGGTETGGAATAGYEVNGSTNVGAIPYPLRLVRGRGVTPTGGEFIVDRSQMEAMMLALSAHHVAEALV